MIVVDIETSGLFPERHGITQLAAFELETLKEFFEDCRIDEEDEIFNKSTFIYGKQMKPATEVTGLSEEQMRDDKKQTQKQLLTNFFVWVDSCETRNVGCENPQFDLEFIMMKARKYNLNCPLGFRAYDLHSISHLRYLQTYRKLKTQERKSAMDLTATLEFCGMKDERKKHNALEDVRLEAECFSRLLYGRNIFREYTKFPIPQYLKQLKNLRRN